MIKHFCDRCGVELAQDPFRARKSATGWAVTGQIYKIRTDGITLDAVEVCDACVTTTLNEILTQPAP
jgi:hypothetical protein